mmetsp:Transcript_6504/g.16453  ORF Transcript_6504/g.16453 Transcript_6504/m.16453 type:complete len:205 (-) Transcript_6504:123-737(-)
METKSDRDELNTLGVRRPDVDAARDPQQPPLIHDTVEARVEPADGEAALVEARLASIREPVGVPRLQLDRCAIDVEREAREVNVNVHGPLDLLAELQAAACSIGEGDREELDVRSPDKVRPLEPRSPQDGRELLVLPARQPFVGPVQDDPHGDSVCRALDGVDFRERLEIVAEVNQDLTAVFLRRRLRPGRIVGGGARHVSKIL